LGPHDSNTKKKSMMPYRNKLNRINIILVLLFLFLSSITLTAPVHRWGDASTYYMQIQSISNDLDIQYQPEDIERVMENRFDELPAGLFLIKTESGKYYYGKEFSYALFASPFYKILGNNGILFFNGLMLFTMILMGYLYLREENEEKIALTVSALFFILSTAFVYIFWIHAEIYNMFLLMTSLFLWERYFKSENQNLLLLASLVFGIAFVAKVPNILLFVPFLLYELYCKRFKNFTLMLCVFLIPLIITYGYFFLNTGSISFYGGERLYYAYQYPFVEGYDSINEAGKQGFSITENRVDALMNIENLKVVPYNLFYYFFGRFTGMFWYYPFTLFALISVFASSGDSRTTLKLNIKNYISSNEDKVLVVIGIILYIVFFCAIIGNNYFGGMDAVGNRYFYLYPAFIYLIKKVDIKKATVIIFIAVLTLNPIIFDPIENSSNPSIHLTTFPYSYLPIEYTQMDTLPFSDYGHKIDNLFVYRLDDKSEYTDGTFVVNGSADMIIKSEKEIESLLILLKSKNHGTDAYVFGVNAKNPINLGMNETKAITTKNLKPVYADKRYIVYKVSVSSSDDLAITFKDVSQTNASVFFFDNWYNMENWNGVPTRWISNNATILIYSKEEQNLPTNLSVMSYYMPRKLEIYNNDILIYDTPVPKQFVTVKTNVSLEEGINMIRFYVPEGCSNTYDVKGSDDNRCLSLAFQNIDIKSDG